MCPGPVSASAGSQRGLVLGSSREPIEHADVARSCRHRRAPPMIDLVLGYSRANTSPLLGTY
jgi:hypothetical protein